MAAEPQITLNLLVRSFSGSKALSLTDQTRDIVSQCERHDIMTFARMVCLKHAGHQDIFRLTPCEAQLFIEDIDLFLTAIISQRLLKQ